MKRKITIKLKLTLCDRNRNFNEILDSICKAIEMRDGVDDWELLEVDGMSNKLKEEKE